MKSMRNFVESIFLNVQKNCQMKKLIFIILKAFENQCFKTGNAKKNKFSI